MIEALRWRPFIRWFARHARGRLRSSFAGVHVHGLDALRTRAEAAPLLLVANHTAWWDALVALWLTTDRLRDLEVYGLMDAANLQRLRFFRWIGVFGVDLQSPRDGARVVRYAASLLQRPRSVVWVFPQGAERPPHEPLSFRGGAAVIGRRAPRAQVVPVAMSYVFEGAERPSVYVSIGEPLPAFDTATAARQGQERAVAAELARIRRQLEAHDQGFETLLSGPEPRVARWASAGLDRIAGWLGDWQARRRRRGAPSRIPLRAGSSPPALAGSPGVGSMSSRVPGGEGRRKHQRWSTRRG